MTLRKPAVAGSFYPSDSGSLSDAIDRCYVHPLGPGREPPVPPRSAPLVAVVCPHAGYEYSGPVAAHSYLEVSSLPDPDLLVVVAPNHYGIGSGVSIFKEGQWETPLGKVRVDSKAAKDFFDLAGIANFDPEAQRLEHSLEVQLPFLQRLYGSGVPLLPISLLFQDKDTAVALAGALSEVVKDRRAVLVASSDLTHYEPAGSAKVKDSALIKKLTDLDTAGFYDVLDSLQVTACGFGAIATVMESVKRLGFVRAELLKYATSGDTTGDYGKVVGYAALRFA
jgi:MEMO1 family protein